VCLHHIKAVTNLASADDKMVICPDCECRDLGRVDGKLGLIQLSIESEIYLIDIIAFPKALRFYFAHGHVHSILEAQFS